MRALQLRRRTKSKVGCWVLNPSAGHERRKQDSVPRARCSRLALDRLVIIPPQPTRCSDRVSVSVTIAVRSMTVTLRPRSEPRVLSALRTAIKIPSQQPVPSAVRCCASAGSYRLCNPRILVRILRIRQI